MFQRIQRFYHHLNLTTPEKFIVVFIAFLILCGGWHSWESHQDLPAQSVEDAGGIAKTHQVDATHMSKRDVQEEQHLSHRQYNGHQKDTPGNDDHPKKG